MNITRIKPNHRARAMEIAVATTGHMFPRLTDLTTEGATSHRVQAETSDYAIVLLDVTLDCNGDIRLIEANGSNAALTSLSVDSDDARARHMATTFKEKHLSEVGGVALLGHQREFLHIPEFFSRAGRFAEHLDKFTDVQLRETTENLGAEHISVVAGPLDLIASNCLEIDEHLFYKQRAVLFASNTNLLPELCRQGRIHRNGGRSLLRTSFFHEGPLVDLVHDKSLQQDVARGTGIRPLLHHECDSREECIQSIRVFHNQERTAVLKINGGSGGCGVEFVPHWLSGADISKAWDSLAESAEEKYGQSIEKTMFPVRVFEFAQSTPYQIGRASHLWDLRVQCLISPGFVDVAPVVIRLCPEPFEITEFSRDSVLSNLSGREASTKFMRSPLGSADNGRGTVLESCGLQAETYTRLIDACVAWCSNSFTADQRKTNYLRDGM